jgi:hypothetical protein
MPKNNTAKIPFQANGLHSVLIASALLAAPEHRFAGNALQPFASSRE